MLANVFLGQFSLENLWDSSHTLLMPFCEGGVVDTIFTHLNKILCWAALFYFAVLANTDFGSCPQIKKNNKELFPPNASVQFTAHIQYIRLGHFCGSKEPTLEAMLKKSPGLKMLNLLFYVCQNTIDVY